MSNSSQPETVIAGDDANLDTFARLATDCHTWLDDHAPDIDLFDLAALSRSHEGRKTIHLLAAGPLPDEATLHLHMLSVRAVCLRLAHPATSPLPILPTGIYGLCLAVDYIMAVIEWCMERLPHLQ
jgi:hypothetical protein